MDDIVKTVRPKITADEIQRRRDALAQASANARLEGQFSSPESEAIFDRYVQGELEIADVLSLLKERHGLG